MQLTLVPPQRISRQFLRQFLTYAESRTETINVPREDLIALASCALAASEVSNGAALSEIRTVLNKFFCD